MTEGAMKRFVVAFLAAGAWFIAAEVAMAAETQPKASAASGISATQQRDVAEAMFRYLFDHNESAAQKKAKAYYLKVLDQDPEDELLERFKGQQPVVGKASEFKTGTGLLFRIQRMTPVTATRVDVQAGYYEGNLSASSGFYIVEMKDGKWVVRPAGPIAVS